MLLLDLLAKKNENREGQPAARPRAREGPPGARGVRRRNVRRGRMQMQNDDSGMGIDRRFRESVKNRYFLVFFVCTLSQRSH